MIGIGHASIGAVIGLAVAVMAPGLPLELKLSLVASLALFSHYMADWIPHGHYHVRYKPLSARNITLFVLDVFVFEAMLMALTLLRFGFGQTFWLVGLGISMALLPDVFEALVRFAIIPDSAFTRAHTYFHFKRLHWHSQPVSSFARLPRPLHKADVYLVVLMLAVVYIIH